ncbi:MAG TPA: NAD(P)/FAD-dependent oxidoreductase [Rhizomicrobium sp.]|jgi:NADH dehydrogenase|nr:NAD(P)/FAD-dependent oxidoreductase [Rhizomicrobium sp.]
MTERVVVIGAGFAGVAVAKGLGAAGVPVTLVDKQNYHLFQPLLYQVATAALSPADIAEPVRRMLRRHPSVDVVLGEASGIDVGAQRVTLGDGKVLTYDRLVLATGATHAYFGHDDWARFAPSLKSIADARAIRSRLLTAFEEAEMIDDPAARRRLMTFVVIGGGPTGVELAGAIAELARYTLTKDFHRVGFKEVNVLLLEAGPRILTAFPEKLADYAVRKLAALGVTVRVNGAVGAITKDGVQVGDEIIPASVAIWAAGVKASPLGALLGVATDKAGRVMVNRDLSVPGLANVYVLGDTALVRDASGNQLAGLAQVAKQEGQYLGRALAKSIREGKASPDFVFRNRGNAAIVGRHSAIFDFGWSRLSGPLAWFLWAFIHIYLLTGFEHRLLVAIQWLWRYLSYDHGARLIVEPERT